MKIRPIQFTGPMILSILAGAKTQTRRVVKPQPQTWESVKRKPFIHPDYPGIWSPLCDNSENRICPHGVPGDQLWVREKCERYPMVNFLTGEPTECQLVRYCADGEPVVESAGFDLAPWFSRATCPSTFMPRAASRITLEITEVRVERVGSISEEDAVAEGCEETMITDADIREAIENPEDESKALMLALGPGIITAKADFANLWDSINGKKPGCAWANSPWVWVISFRRVEAS